MSGVEMMKGLGDGMVNCRLGGVEVGEFFSHLVDDTGIEPFTNGRQLENAWENLHEKHNPGILSFSSKNCFQS